MPSEPTAPSDVPRPIPVLDRARDAPVEDGVRTPEPGRAGVRLLVERLEPVGMRIGLLGRRLEIVVPVAIGLLAFGLRLMVLLRGGGLGAIGDYDDGVYYTAAASLLHGHLPYRDFLFIQPPGIVIAALPFAAIGTAAGDSVGFALGRVAFELIGGLNAALAYFAVRRFGRTAAIVAGVVLAVLLPAVYSERSILIEPLGTLGILGCLVLLSRRDSALSIVLAGVAAGWAVDVKITYVVPVLVILVLGTRHRLQFAGGVAAALALGYGPFFLPAPVAAFREIVLDQLGRPVSHDLMTRVIDIVGARPVGPLDLLHVTLLMLVLIAIAVGVALTVRGAKVFPVMLLADAALLVLTPSWFEHYADLTAPPLALCCGIAVARLVRRVRPTPVRGALAAVVAVVVLLGGLATDHVEEGRAVPPQFARAVRAVGGCVTTDDPTLLVVTDVLTRDLSEPRCTVWPDVSGWTYDRYAEKDAHGRPVSRADNARWQRAVVAYLEAGHATVLVRPVATGLTVASRRHIYHQPLVLRVGTLGLHLTTTTTGTEARHERHHHLHPHVR
ncbi:hypothetical protein [Amnibacterium kyonggiense]|uniref:Dolichyl-phosphate-mannose-protein mannosyltransferase n=1 Tax=Amnibacterium kyonggiense TaxID=595671 RepID=A0A4R7FSF5_9MICO|nr:hypothetical protein [Amnibacterium kyonggiense]TDS80773.1 hypothetical protein CLV52_1342 [Amnibacterium kyonggiense]